ncbi:hypothetical protein C1708_10155 [Streptomyces sp. DH-12]|nr:hypothetical protein C1708_10155 [Streptomyces sp. DH-12]
MSVIDVTDLRKAYGGRPAADGVSFSVDEGGISGIHGPSDAGRTTTVECGEGLRVPDAGRVRAAGLGPVADHEEVTRILGAQLQQSGLQPEPTVRETPELRASFHPRPAGRRPLAERPGLRDTSDAHLRRAGRQGPGGGRGDGVRPGHPRLTARLRTPDVRAAPAAAAPTAPAR